MTTASQESAAKLKPTRNADIYATMRRMAHLDPFSYTVNGQPAATAEEIIHFLSGKNVMSAVEGKRLSQPVYRALSEGAAEGILDDTLTVTNSDTGARNTMYVLLNTPKKAKESNTWKAKYLELEVKYKDLLTKYEVACSTIDKINGN